MLLQAGVEILTDARLKKSKELALNSDEVRIE